METYRVINVLNATTVEFQPTDSDSLLLNFLCISNLRGDSHNSCVPSKDANWKDHTSGAGNGNGSGGAGGTIIRMVGIVAAVATPQSRRRQRGCAAESFESLTSERNRRQ